MKNDDEEYGIPLWMHFIATTVLALLALVAIAGLIGFLWGLLL